MAGKKKTNPKPQPGKTTGNMTPVDDWVVTHGISYVVNDLVPEAAKRLQTKPRCKPVLIVAPTGSGKTHIKDLIVKASGLNSAEEERINCAAFPETLIESGLYGSVKGAFTGAYKDTIGIIKEGAQNVIVLDEIGTLPHHRQAKLLTFLDNGEFRRVGDEKTSVSNQKIIGITNLTNYPESLRDDFRHRFFVVPIPGLAERRHDIPILLHMFAPGVEWTYLDMLRLVAYNWPGNLRELRRFAELAQDNRVEINKKRAGVLEWFESQFQRYELGRAVSSQNVPVLGDYDGFFSDRLWEDYSDLAAKLDKKLPLFPMSCDKIGNNIQVCEFEDDDAPVKWLQNWQTWCHIFCEDAFSPHDIWKRRILVIKPVIIEGDKETHYTLRNGGQEIDDLTFDISDSTLGKNSDTKRTYREPLNVRIVEGASKTPLSKTPDPLQVCLENYSPQAYKTLWLEHNTSRRKSDIAKQYKLNLETVRSMFKRK